MPDPRPNIILLTGEDTGLHLGCYGQTYASTPHLDALAKRGTRFTHAISTAPVCSPSRSTIVTGQYPWSIGTHHHRSQLFDPPRLFTHELRDAGYYVNWSSKRDFNFDPADDWVDEDRPWLDDLRAGAVGDAMGKGDKPFFLYHNFTVTHESTMWRYDKGGAGCVARVQNQHRLSPEQRHDWRDAPVPAYLPDEPEVRADIARYFDALSIQDAQVGEVLDALAASPYADNTIVIYTSDHGRGPVREKRWCYEAGLHLPLLIAGPGIDAGAVDQRVVNWPDHAATILSLAGVAVPARMQGVSYLGEPKREYAFAGRGRMDEAYDSVRACRDARFLYVRNDEPQLPYAQHNVYEIKQITTQVMRELHARGLLTGPPAAWFARTKPPEELYDVHADPDCVRNLAEDAAYADDLARLRGALEAHLEDVGDLGAVPERQLIDRGLVADTFDYLRGRHEPLGEAYAIGDHRLCAMEKESG